MPAVPGPQAALPTRDEVGEATLIVNVQAGGAAGVDGEDLAAALRRAGYDAKAWFTTDADEVQRALDDSEGLVVSVGGDGTLREIARHMIGGTRPLAIVPLGTANNVAASLGLLGARSPVDLLAGLARPRPRRLDVGHVVTSLGERIFLEACGLGFYAELLADYRPEKGKNVIRALEALDQVVRGFRPWSMEIEVDGTVHRGPFVLATVMNTPRMGPRLPLAPDADPTDGSLDLVLVRHDEEHSLFGHAARLVRGTLENVDTVTRIPIRRCVVRGRGAPMHVDDENFAAGAGHLADEIEVEVLPAALPLWLPEEETPA